MPRRDPLQAPAAPQAPPPWDCRPQTAHARSSISQIHRSISTPPPQHLGRPLSLATPRGAPPHPPPHSLSPKDSGNKRRKEGNSSTPPSPRSPPRQAPRLRSSIADGPSALRPQHGPPRFQQHHRPAPRPPQATGAPNTTPSRG
jgi:hypothetical protein